MNLKGPEHTIVINIPCVLTCVIIEKAFKTRHVSRYAVTKKVGGEKYPIQYFYAIASHSYNTRIKLFDCTKKKYDTIFM